LTIRQSDRRFIAHSTNFNYVLAHLIISFRCLSREPIFELVSPHLSLTPSQVAALACTSPFFYSTSPSCQPCLCLFLTLLPEFIQSPTLPCATPGFSLGVSTIFPLYLGVMPSIIFWTSYHAHTLPLRWTYFSFTLRFSVFFWDPPIHADVEHSFYFFFFCLH